MFEKFVIVRPVADDPKLGWVLELKVGPQSFQIGPQFSSGERSEADFIAKMLRLALARIVEQVGGPAPVGPHFVDSPAVWRDRPVRIISREPFRHWITISVQHLDDPRPHHNVVYSIEAYENIGVDVFPGAEGLLIPMPGKTGWRFEKKRPATVLGSAVAAIKAELDDREKLAKQAERA